MDLNIINHLIDIDKKARLIIKDAENKSLKILKSLSIARQEFEDKYHNKGQIMVNKVKEEEDNKIKENSQIIKENYKLYMKKLEKSYFANHKKIENQIFNRVINDELD